MQRYNLWGLEFYIFDRKLKFKYWSFCSLKILLEKLNHKHKFTTKQMEFMVGSYDLSWIQKGKAIGCIQNCLLHFDIIKGHWLQTQYPVWLPNLFHYHSLKLVLCYRYSYDQFVLASASYLCIRFACTLYNLWPSLYPLFQAIYHW